MANTELTTQNGIQFANFDYNGYIQQMSTEDKNSALALTDKLDWHNSSTLVNFGAELNNTISKNGDVLLNTVKSDSSIEVVGYINNILSELNGFEEDINRYTGQHSNPFKRFLYSLPFVKSVATSLQNVVNEYNTVAENVDKISQKISNAKIVALRDNSTLQQIFESNVQYIGQMRKMVVGLKLKSQELQDELNQRLSSNQFNETYELSDMQDFIHKIDKRVADLQTSEYVLTQNLLQIRATMNNNTAIAEKTDNIVNHVIPIWKNQLPMAIILKNQESSIDAQKKITETTNKLIAKTANDLKINSIAVAKASEEAVISIDTLKTSTQDLITTINEVKKIHDDGNNQRNQLEKQLKEMSEQIHNAVTRI